MHPILAHALPLDLDCLILKAWPVLLGALGYLFGLVRTFLRSRGR